MAAASPGWESNRPAAWALQHPRAEAESAPLLAGTPWALLAGLTAALVVAVACRQGGQLSSASLRTVATGVGHAALLATAMAWSMPASSGPRAVVAAGLLVLATACSMLGGAGSIAYLLVPAWLAVLALRGDVARLGLDPSLPVGWVLVGAGIGVLLAVHLLVSASLTFGHPLGALELARILSLIAYDVGANVLVAECFFRGALFDRALRRCSFVRATVLSTAAYLLRYLVDPSLPRTVEGLVGCLFYLSLLGVANCWLFWSSGSLFPGLVAALLFFGTYRLLPIP